MEDSQEFVNWNPSSHSKSKEKSVLNISKSVLQEYGKVLESKNYNFIPFTKERDGLGRLLNSNSVKFVIKAKSKKLSPIKKESPKRKLLLRSPVASETPPVGTYSTHHSWSRPSFNRKSLNKNEAKLVQSPSETSTEKLENLSKEKIVKKRELFTLERKVNFLPRKKGIWEDIKIRELPRGMKVSSVEESSSFVSDQHSKIMSSMKKFKHDMLSIEKYL